MIPAETARRIQVLDLRQRLESIAARAFDETCEPPMRGQRNQINGRLAFILAADQSGMTTAQLHALLRIARHVYAKSSDVLHGRISMVSFPQVVVDEWHEVIEQLEAIYPPSPASTE